MTASGHNTRTDGDNVLQRIARRRRERIAAEGHALGVTVPETRQVPLVPFGGERFLICEIKRSSPSRGAIAAELDPVEQAGRYATAGVPCVSVLTEEEWFSGSLQHMIDVKRAHPGLSVLRKDFLLDDEDIDIAYRAGADAILLIAALLSPARLSDMLKHAESLGLSALVELHTEQELEGIRPLRPKLVGVNARDLTTFKVDRLVPVRLRASIDWPCETVFESGIWSAEDARFVRRSGFSGALVGEAVVRRPDRIQPILEALGEHTPDDVAGHGFWARIAALSARERPLVKICGLCRREDVLLADELGADLMGFNFAPSPRRTTGAFVRALPPLRALRVAVVVVNRENPEIPTEVRNLLAAGLVDAVQFHGDETPEYLSRFEYPYYKAVRLGGTSTEGGTSTDDELERFRSPRVLIDAFSKAAYGGTGKTLDDDAVRSVASAHPLWLAGGLSPENIRGILTRHRPELIDAASRLESAPGEKDHSKLRAFFRNIEAAAERNSIS